MMPLKGRTSHTPGRRWRRLLVSLSHRPLVGRTAARLARLGLAPGPGCVVLAHLHARGYAAPSACLAHPRMHFGRYVYFGDRVLAFADQSAGEIEIADRVELYSDVTLRTGPGGRIEIGSGTHVQPGCLLASFLASIQIGQNVEIAAACAFYSYSHGSASRHLIMQEPLVSKGPIIVGDGAWIGHGATVLNGVTIGHGAIIGAGAVVTRDVPDEAIAAGVPARVIGRRKAGRPEAAGAALTVT